MHSKLNIRVLLVAFVTASVGPTRCGLPTTATIAQELPPAIVINEGKTSQGYPYLAGGVSSEEREIMEQRGKSYNVKLVFADKRGPYIAGVNVRIEGLKGTEIVNVPVDGPWFYIQLPPGSYNVKASFQGKMKEVRRLDVPKGKIVRRTLTWDLGEPSK